MVNSIMIWKEKVIHFIGICGTSMSTLARICAQNSRVSGTDRQASEIPVPTCQVFLEDGEIHIPKDVDYVVYTTGIDEKNNEYRYCKEKGIPLVHRTRLLHHLTSDRFKICVIGSSGKTSTTYYTRNMLQQLGQDPFTIIGEFVFPDGESFKGFEEGSGPYIVELNEADMKFYEESSDILIFTNYGLDHIWLFENEEELVDHYYKLFEKCKHVVYYEESKFMEKARIQCPETKFHKVKCEILQVKPNWQEFKQITTFEYNNRIYRTFLYGTHSVYNICTAMKAVEIFMAEMKFEGFSIDTEQISHCKRRSQVLYKSDNLVIVDDQALHYNEMETMLNTMKIFNKPVSIMIDCYGPMRRNAFLENYKTIAKSYRSASKFPEIEPLFLIESDEDIRNFVKNTTGVLVLTHKFDHNLLNLINDMINDLNYNENEGY